MKRFALIFVGIFALTLLLCPVTMVHADHMHDGFSVVAMHQNTVSTLSSALFFFVAVAAVVFCLFWITVPSLFRPKLHVVRNVESTSASPPYVYVWLATIFHAPPQY